MTKTEKDLDLLRQCIEHWAVMEENPLDGGHQPYGDDCALCEEYVPTAGFAPCDGCPIAEHTGRPSCMGTPYGDARYAWERLQEQPDDPAAAEEWNAASAAEIKFLRERQAELRGADTN